MVCAVCLSIFLWLSIHFRYWSMILTRYAMNTGWWEIDIHGCYSLVKITFAPIGTGELWWHHNAKSEKTVLSDNCEMSDCWLFLAESCVQDIKECGRNKIIHSLPWITIFWSLVMRFANDFHSWLCHSWKSLANHLTRDRKIIIHGNSWIILYFLSVFCAGFRKFHWIRPRRGTRAWVWPAAWNSARVLRDTLGHLVRYRPVYSV